MNITEKSIVLLLKQLGNNLEQVGHQTAQILSQFQSVADQYVAFNQQNQLLWSGLNEKFKEAFKQTNIALEKAEVLGTLGWTLPMDATPREYVSLVDSISDISSADKTFTGYYMEHEGIRLKSLEDSLIIYPDLQPWKPVLEEAISGLEYNRYRCCIALLLPLIEGITAIKFSKPQFHKGAERKKFFMAKLRATQRGSLNEFMWRSYKGFAEMLFRSSDFSRSSRKPSTLNRHWLLHGRDIPNSDLTDCLRLLQAIDTITALR